MWSKEGKWYPDLTIMRQNTDASPELGSYIDLNNNLRVVAVKTKQPETYAVCMKPQQIRCIRCISFDLCNAPILSDQ